MEKIKTESFYELKLPLEGVNTINNGQRCKKYQLSRIVGSNSFLGIILRESDDCSSLSCPCSSNRECSGVHGLSCQCPCSTRLDFQYCTTEFPKSNVSICPVPAAVLSSKQVNDPSTKGLEKCFDPECDKKMDSDSCDGVVGCYWCVRDQHNAPLSKQYCADINKCYGGKEGTRAPGSPSHDSPTVDEKEDEGSTSKLLIALCSVGGLLAVLFVVFFFLKRKYNWCACRNTTPPSLTAQRVRIPSIRASNSRFTPSAPPVTTAYPSEAMSNPAFSWHNELPSPPPYNPNFENSEGGQRV
ncbi:hypothetical protein ACROYT_G034411 [Oculina patagonica]